MRGIAKRNRPHEISLIYKSRSSEDSSILFSVDLYINDNIQEQETGLLNLRNSNRMSPVENPV